MHNSCESQPLIELRRAETDADLEAWRQVRMGVLPNERCQTIDWMRASLTPERVYLLAFLGGVLAGSGLGGRSDFDLAGLHPRVLPWARRRGVGTVLLHALSEHAVARGFEEAGTNVDDPGSLTFARQFGCHEVDRQLEQVRVIGNEVAPTVPAGIEIVRLAERPGLWRAAYDPLGLEALADLATDRPVVASLEQWERQWLAVPEGMFIALAGDEIVGCAGLEPDLDRPERAEHALTAVLRAWRGRGVTTALVHTTLCFAAASGIRELSTWTQQGNDGMRRLNERLGYTVRSESITLRCRLPIRPSHLLAESTD